MFNTNNGYSLADIAAATGNNDNGFGNGNNAWWIILLFLVFGWGWGGYGGGVGGRNASELQSVYEGYVLNNDFSQLSKAIGDSYAMTERKLDSITNGVCDGFYATAQHVNGINSNIMTVGNAIQSQLADCCCKTQSNIGDVKYAIGTTNADINYNIATQANALNNAMQSNFCQTNFNAQNNTRDIVDAQNAGTQAILARIDALESARKDEKIAELVAKNTDLRLAASQAAQNTYLIDQLKPCPSPAYIVPNPFCCNNNVCNC